MKSIRDYLDDQLPQEEDEQATRQLFSAYFSKKEKARQQRWARLLEQQAQVKRSPRSVQTTKPAKVRWLVLLAAASVAAFVLLVWPIAKPISIEQQLAIYLQTHHPEGNIRKDLVAGAEEQEARARSAYNEQQFAEATVLWQGLASQHPAVFEYQFFAALSLLYQPEPDYQRVVLLLEQVMHNSQRLDEEARWYLALVRLELKHDERAKQLLRFIVDNGHWKAKEAEQLLQWLE